MSTKFELDEFSSIYQELSQKLLVIKADQNQSWRNDISPLIAKAASFYGQTTGNTQSILSEQENLACLQVIACLGYSAIIGIKEAKKRNLNIKYWDSNPFPSVIQNIAIKELQIAAYKKLSVTKNPISEKYIWAELAITFDRDVRASQFNWLIKIKGAPQFLETINEIAKGDGLQSLYYDSLEYINEQIKKRILSVDCEICRALSNQVEITSITDNPNLESLHTELVSTISSLQPEISLSVEFLIYLTAVKGMGKNNKKFEKVAETISRRYFDFVEAIGNINPEYIQNPYFIELANTYSPNISDFESLKKLQPKKYSFFLTGEQVTPNTTTDIETAAIELAVSWSEYEPENGLSAQGNYIGKKIENLLHAVNIEQYSSTEQVKAFDPTKDESISAITSLHTKVKVIKPGFIHTRSNGTVKVLRKAIVEKIDE